MNIKADHIIWKVIFLVQCSLTVFLIYDNQLFSSSEISVAFVDIVIFVLDSLVLSANLLLILQVRVLSRRIWILVVWVWWFANIYSLLNEFYLGGYTSSEMLFFGNIIWILILFSLPVVKYGSFIGEPIKS
ncbi:hypothetical protein CWB89_05455 [Pseudoalteromonas piscicida]|uniref:Uncharacterized protein n=1 Tax=Pseudoalteromonas piscicida TaxID=43662 RepID=A0AAQ2ITI9_PSEO7|nr:MULTISPECIES: hypothetical protein [Pseudoalteromonas]TMN82022.1 hypothetical protein CWB87_09790 [Pseudoalteromonas flavipulchra]KJY89795.1 hypothetical protein TW75_08930 [Pseudoalteromonas piscicida]MDP4487080.1 hypothetical protein [Pseudoalteromonas piscicida]TMN34151.1 hypothetical protein CWB95_21515 [Pseudoalteromonas piscicida]TMN34762.1 hypothetical protein CWB94_22400 [Pseudoalteromonas piscicida]